MVILTKFGTIKNKKMITIKTSNDKLANDILNEYICSELTSRGIKVNKTDIFEVGQLLRFNSIKFHVL